MKKFIPGVVLCVLTLSGCGHRSNNSLVPVDEKVETPQIILQKELPSNTMKESSNTIVASIEAQIASKEFFTYQLPIANTVITKREVSGYLDADKTGKISKVEIGMGEVKDEYYFEKGALVFLRTTTQFTVDGKVDIQVREMSFENGKMVQHTYNSEAVTDTSNDASLEQQGTTDAVALLEEFEMKKELNG